MTADHTAQFEEVMALLDGELPADAAERVRLHLTSCADCQQFAGEMRGVSERVAVWHVGHAAAALRANVSRPWFRNRMLLAAAAMLVLVVGAFPLLVQRRSPAAIGASEISLSNRAGAASGAASRPPARSIIAGQEGKPADAPRVSGGPLIIRNASLSIVVRDYEAARGELDRIAKSVNGFIGELTAFGARGEAPSLRGTLRVPATRLDEAIAALKKLGDVQQDSLGSDDVTQQWTDLEARLANARASEARLKDVLQNRTGRLSDVLEVEREIARVRGEIEQMEAQRKSLDNAITYAVIRLELTSERKAEAGTGPVSISTRLRNAIVDGYVAAVERAVSLVVFLAEILPTLIVWTIVLAPVGLFIRRRRIFRVFS
jgi:hypothetical protein